MANLINLSKFLILIFCTVLTVFSVTVYATERSFMKERVNLIITINYTANTFVLDNYQANSYEKYVIGLVQPALRPVGFNKNYCTIDLKRVKVHSECNTKLLNVNPL